MRIALRYLAGAVVGALIMLGFIDQHEKEIAMMVINAMVENPDLITALTAIVAVFIERSFARRNK